MAAVVQRALIIRVSALGDVVLTEPVARALRSAHPGIAVDLATDARYAELMMRAGYDRVITIDRKKPAPIEGRYDVVVDLQGKLRTRALARKIDAEKRVTLRKRTAGRAVLSLFGWDPPLFDRHSTEIYLGALDQLGIQAEIDRAPRLARRHHADGLTIGLAPGATHATKRWPIDRFAELADRLQEALPEARFVPVGGAGDRPLLEQLVTGAKRARFETDTSSLDVEALAQRLERFSLLISVDTGPAHIAAALGVPVVVLFGPTSPVRWGPIGEPHRAVSLALECAPCSNIGQERCPLPGAPHSCMRDLGVERIHDAALSALKGRA